VQQPKLCHNTHGPKAQQRGAVDDVRSSRRCVQHVCGTSLWLIHAVEDDPIVSSIMCERSLCGGDPTVANNAVGKKDRSVNEWHKQHHERAPPQGGDGPLSVLAKCLVVSLTTLSGLCPGYVCVDCV